MAATLILIAATAAVWLLVVIWRRAISVPKINARYFAFEGDNSATRYIAEAGSLLTQGYEKVSLQSPATFAALPTNHDATKNSVYEKWAAIHHAQRIGSQAAGCDIAAALS